jgi:hypothetical protein
MFETLLHDHNNSVNTLVRSERLDARVQHNRNATFDCLPARETTARSQLWRGSGEVDPSSFSSIPCGHNIGYSGRRCQLTATDTVGG